MSCSAERPRRSRQSRAAFKARFSTALSPIYGAHEDVLKSGHGGADPYELEGPSNASSADKMRLETDETPGLIQDGAGVWAVDARDHVEKGALSCAVRSDEAQDISFVQTEGDILEDLETTEHFCETFYFKKHAILSEGLPMPRDRPSNFIRLLSAEKG